MVKLKEQTIKALDGLDAPELLLVYEMILKLKKARTPKKRSKSHVTPPYQKVRKALKACKGQLSDDIIELREERL